MIFLLKNMNKEIKNSLLRNFMLQYRRLVKRISIVKNLSPFSFELDLYLEQIMKFFLSHYWVLDMVIKLLHGNFFLEFLRDFFRWSFYGILSGFYNGFSENFLKNYSIILIANLIIAIFYNIQILQEIYFDKFKEIVTN